MIYKSLNKDFYYVDSGSTRLSYYLTCGDETIYTGRAYNPNGIKINLRKIIEDWLWNDMPDFREYDGVIVTHEDAYKPFNLYNDEGTLLEEYKVFLSYEDWQGEDMFFNNPIDGKADPRQKIFVSALESIPTSFDIVGWAPLEVTLTGDFDIPAEGGTIEIGFVSNTDFTIEETCDWLTVTKSGETEGTLTIVAEENLGEERACTITLVQEDVGSFEGSEYVFEVTQEQPAEYFIITSGEYEEFPFSGGTWTMEFRTNCSPILYEVSDGTSGYTTGNELVLILPANAQDTPVNYEVNFYYGSTLMGTSEAVVKEYSRYISITSIPSSITYYQQVIDIEYETDCDGRVQYELYSAYTGGDYVLAKSGRTDSLTGLSVTIGENLGEGNVDYHMIVRASDASAPTVWVTSDDRYFTQGYPSQYARQYLTLEILSGGTIQTPSYQSYSGTKYYYFSRNSGSTWTALNPTGVTIPVNEGETIMLKGSRTGTVVFSFSGSTATFNACGNIMSLYAGDNFFGAVPPSNYFLQNLFGETNVVDASNLILPNVTAEACYRYMFFWCQQLIHAPELPAAVLEDNCYERMFQHCRSLVEPPAILATTVSQNCCYYMFNDCISLRETPKLLSPVLKDSCYEAMFSGCTSLIEVTCLATDRTYARWPTYNWLKGVSSTGTFTKAAGVTWDTGTSGIPEGWTVIDAE